MFRTSVRSFIEIGDNISKVDQNVSEESYF